MRTRLLVPVLAVVGFGCEYGPEHLPMLYQVRDNHYRHALHLEATIERIEMAHHKIRGSRINEAEKLHQLYAEKDMLKTRNENLRRELTESEEDLADFAERNRRLQIEVNTLGEQWFAKLSVDQQIKWRMHRDQIFSGATREVKITQDLTPTE